MRILKGIVALLLAACGAALLATGWETLPWVFLAASLYFLAALWWPALLPLGRAEPHKPIPPSSERPGFAVDLLTSPGNVDIEGRGYLQLCSIAVTNTSGTDLEKRCLVTLENIGGQKHLENAMLPLTMRTEGQIRSGRTGRFGLSAGERKVIPLVLTSSHRRNEWFVFDERGESHFIPADSMELAIGIAGGARNCRVRIKIDVTGPHWKTTCSIVETKRT